MRNIWHRSALCVFFLSTGAISASAANLVQHELYRCELSGLASSGGNGSGKVAIHDLTPFSFNRMSLPDEPNRFGFGSSKTNSVGVGKLNDNGVWYIDDWQARDRRGPQLTLVSFYPNKSILVSVATGSKSHVTFAGLCKEQ